MTAMAAAPKVTRRVGGINDISVAHSISSTVLLDRVAGTAHKTYAPPVWVRALYRIAFQAPFPYANNADALEAARLRREIAGRLMTYWSGNDLVAGVVDVPRHINGRMGFVTELVPGTAPTDKRHARNFLRTVTRRFLDAGLPTWQVTPYNPRAVGNLIESPDGSYRVIDLESNLVAPLFPVSGIVGMIRQATFPVFDDIDVQKLNSYLASERGNITATMGAPYYKALVYSSASYEAAAKRWHDAEPRIISRALRFALRLVDVPQWARAIKRMASNGRTMSDKMISNGIDDWTAEGYIEESDAAALREQAKTPEVASAMTHLGAHVAMSIPLRFPLGSIARPAWTLAARAAAEWRAFRGKASAASARREHTMLVAAASAVPGFGAAAYMLSAPLRSNRLLAVIAFDRPMRKLPFALYRKLHLAPVMAFQAGIGVGEKAKVSARSMIASTGRRIAGLRPHALPIAALLAVNLSVVVAGGIVYAMDGTRGIFDERGLMNTLDAAQLVVAGVLGMVAWAAFWRSRGDNAPLDERAGILFWGIAGAGLIALAADDYFGIHEVVGEWMASFSMVPLFTNTADDMLTLIIAATGGTIIYIFRNELVAPRASSTLLLGAVGASVLMVAADAYGFGILRGLEFPAQVSAVGLLLLAFWTRSREVRVAA
jgi:hypothetical protein